MLSAVTTPVGRLYVGFKADRIAYVSLDTGEPADDVVARAERRLHRRVVQGEAPRWLVRALDASSARGPSTTRVVDISDLTPFEQAALRAAAHIPPGEVRSYAWVATQIGRPEGRARGRPRDGAQSAAAALSLPSRRRLVRRSAQLLLRSRDESSTSRDGGLPRLDANLSEGGDAGDFLIQMSDPRIAAIPDVHGHAKGEHRPVRRGASDRVFGAHALPLVLSRVPARVAALL